MEVSSISQHKKATRNAEKKVRNSIVYEQDGTSSEVGGQGNSTLVAALLGYDIEHKNAPPLRMTREINTSSNSFCSWTGHLLISPDRSRHI